jgi:acyl-CoA synthetase (AMP-forming)/AMP-acid ligase II
MAAASLRPSAFLSAIQSHDPDSIAVVHSISGRQFTYGALLHDIAAAKQKVLSAIGRKEDELAGERVAFLVENSYDYVGMQYHYNQWHALSSANSECVPQSHS